MSVRHLHEQGELLEVQGEFVSAPHGLKNRRLHRQPEHPDAGLVRDHPGPRVSKTSFGPRHVLFYFMPIIGSTTSSI